jgi:peptidoglycan hydrolase CwlO-like protein
MKKRLILLGGILLFLLYFLLGCGSGVTQEEYDATLAQLKSSQHELQSAKTELGLEQAKVLALTSQLETVKAKLQEQPDVEAIRSELESMKAELEKARTSLAESISNVSSLQAHLQKANDEIDIQTKANSALTEELNKLKYPRHFESLQELKSWLQKDDTDTRYPDATSIELAYILQAKAAGDGYLLPTYLQFLAGNVRILYNIAFIGDQIYQVMASDDDVVQYLFAQIRLPLYPITPD